MASVWDVEGVAWGLSDCQLFPSRRFMGFYGGSGAFRGYAEINSPQAQEYRATGRSDALRRKFTGPVSDRKGVHLADCLGLLTSFWGNRPFRIEREFERIS